MRGCQLPDGTDLRQVKILRRCEYDRLQNNLHSRKLAEEKAKLERMEKEREYKEYKELVKGWPNTIIGERKRKLQAKKLREEAEEQRRVEIDLEEAKYLSQKRKETIEKAKMKQFHNTDRLKHFHGALLLTEVLKERDQQIEIKKLREKHEKYTGGHEKWLKQIEADIADEKEKEEIKAKERKDYQKYIVEQHKKDQEKKAKAKEEWMEEGRKARHKHQLFEMEQEQMKKDWKQKQRDTLAMYNDQLDKKNQLRELKKAMEEEEDEEIRVYAKGQYNYKKMMREKTKANAMANNERMEKRKAHLADIYSTFERRVRKGVDYLGQDRVEREKETEQAKVEKVEKMKGAIKEHRIKTLAEEEAKRKQKWLDSKEELRQRRANDQRCREEDMAKAVDNRRRGKNIEKFNRDQINARAEQERQEREYDLLAQKKLVEFTGHEEKMFADYAKKVIEDAKERGRNVYPLVKAAKSGFGSGHGPVNDQGQRPSYYSATWDQSEMPNMCGKSTQEVKQHTDGGEAGKAKTRLGFTY